MKLALTLLLSIYFVACDSSSDDKKEDKDHNNGVLTYAKIAYANYLDAYNSAQTLKTKIDEFAANPGSAKFDGLKQAWLTAREDYGKSEVFRFYGGPIDADKTGPEGELNAWPLDEAFIDYVDGKPNGGIINNTAVELTKQYLRSNNALDPEEVNVTIGYHAIEFLLWGQDLSNDAAGKRPYTDYLSTNAGTASNQDRRRLYLKLVAEMLVEDLKKVVDEWKDNADNYRKKFIALDQVKAIENILNGMGKLSQGELAGERMNVALTEKNQEHEHSCFSDNTHRDIILNAKGIQNVYLGEYKGSSHGKGLYDLFKTKDSALAEQLKTEMQATMTAVNAIPAPFDQAIIPSNGNTQKVKDAINALRKQAETIVKIAKLYGITVDPNDI